MTVLQEQYRVLHCLVGRLGRILYFYYSVPLFPANLSLLLSLLSCTNTEYVSDICIFYFKCTFQDATLFHKLRYFNLSRLRTLGLVSALEAFTPRKQINLLRKTGRRRLLFSALPKLWKLNLSIICGSVSRIGSAYNKGDHRYKHC